MVWMLVGKPPGVVGEVFQFFEIRQDHPGGLCRSRIYSSISFKTDSIFVARPV